MASWRRHLRFAAVFLLLAALVGLLVGPLLALATAGEEGRIHLTGGGQVVGFESRREVGAWWPWSLAVMLLLAPTAIGLASHRSIPLPLPHVGRLFATFGVSGAAMTLVLALLVAPIVIVVPWLLVVPVSLGGLFGLLCALVLVAAHRLADHPSPQP